MPAQSSRSIARAAIRERLTAIALREFMAHGFRAVTLDDLARESGVSRSTLIRHVGSKDDALVTALTIVGRQVGERLRQQPGGALWPALRRAMEVFTETHEVNQQRALQLTTLIYNDPDLMRARWHPQLVWRAAISEAIRERSEDMDEISSDTIATAAIGALDVATAAWVASAGAQPLDQLLDVAFDSLTRTVSVGSSTATSK